MKKFLSIKSLMLLALTATAFVSCKEDELNAVKNPLILSETTMTINQYATKTISVTNAGVEPTTIIYGSSDNQVATVKNGVITALSPGTTAITAFVEGQYLSTISLTSCIVTVSNVPPTAVKFITKLEDFKTVTLNTADTILFDVVPQDAACEIVVNSSDTVLQNMKYTIIMAPANSSDPDKLVMNPLRAGDLNLTLSIKDTKLSTAKAEIKIKDIKPTSMQLHLFNDEDAIIKDDLVLEPITLKKGESVTLWAKFNPVENSYQELKSIVGDDEFVRADIRPVTFKTKTFKGDKDSTYTRPGVVVTAIATPDYTPHINVNLLNNSGLSTNFTIIVEKGKDVYTQTIKAPADKVTLVSTKDNEYGEVILDYPTFDEGAPDTDFEIIYDFTPRKDKEGKNLPMLAEGDLRTYTTWDDDKYGFNISKGRFLTNQGFANVVFRAVTKEWDPNAGQYITTPLLDKENEFITDTMLVEIPVDVWFNEDTEYKQAYTFNNTDNKYSLRVNLSTNYSLEEVKATLYRNTYKMVDDKEVLDKEIKVGKSILLERQSWTEHSGTFDPFEGQYKDKELKNYFVKYEITVVDGDNNIKFSNIVTTITVDDGFTKTSVR